MCIRDSGNKGVVSRIMAREDMPFLPTGEPVHLSLIHICVVDKENKRVTEEIRYMTADEEDKYIVAQANDCLLYTSTWLDKIDLNIMPYVDAPEWENRYPTISALLMSNANKRELQLSLIHIWLTIFIHLHHLRKLRCRWSGSCHCRYRFYLQCPYCRAWNFACFLQFPVVQ